jgi:two-component sensor histidine kinase
LAEKPVVEAAPDAPDPFELTKRALEQRIRQQEILAELGVLALRGVAFEELSQQTSVLVAEGMEAEFSKVLEYLRGENVFLVRAGVGWDEGVVGVATVGADLESPAGFALQTGKPVISNHLDKEDRFRTPQLLLEHGVHRAANVILQGDGAPYGVLEVDSRAKDEFTEHDLSFLQGAANILGMAIERQRFEHNLAEAKARQDVLFREIDHRVKNSLQLIVSILSLQSSSSNNPEVAHHLKEAARRISAIARVHRRLYETNRVESVDLGPYLEDLCRDMHDSAPSCQIHVEAAAGINVPTNQAINIGIVVSELVTNATKHAYPGRSEQQVWVTLSGSPSEPLTLSVRDQGVGLPGDEETGTTIGMGMRILTAILQQMDATLSINRARGTEFVISIPIEAAPN